VSKRSPEYMAAYQAHAVTVPELHRLEKMEADGELSPADKSELQALRLYRAAIWRRISANA